MKTDKRIEQARKRLMRQMKLTVDDARRIEREIDLWSEILTAYRESEDAGIAAYKTKNDTCGLCPAYKKYIWMIIDGKACEMLSCRQCPIVRVEGRTCAGLRNLYNLPIDFFESRSLAIYGVSITIEKLKSILAKINKEIENG